MPLHHDRKTYPGRDFGMPELELFGWAATSSATESRLTQHRHENAFEICLIARGSVCWWAGNESYRLKRGSVYVTRPDELHGGVDGVMHPCELYWFILPCPGEHPLPDLTEQSTRQLFARLSNLQARTFPSSPVVQSCFTQLHEEFRHPDPMSQLACRGLLHRLLVQLLRDHDEALGGDGEAGTSAPIERTLDWLSRHLGEELSVADMARVARMGSSRFHERFVDEVGLTPAEYLSWARVLRAKELLATTTRTVSSIGFDLGFSSSQYFATVFKKFVGMTPINYRAGRAPAGRLERGRTAGRSSAARV